MSFSELTCITLKNREYTLVLIQCTVPCTKDNCKNWWRHVDIIKYMVVFITFEKKSYLCLVVISFPQLSFLQKKPNAMRLTSFLRFSSLLAKKPFDSLLDTFALSKSLLKSNVTRNDVLQHDIKRFFHGLGWIWFLSKSMSLPRLGNRKTQLVG